MARLTRLMFALVLVATTAAACEVVVGYRLVDPPVDLEALDFDIEITGDPGLDMGFYHEQLYEPMHDGDDCPVVNGLQGGTWVMPALRIEGIYPFADAACSLVMETGEVVGEVLGASVVGETLGAAVELVPSVTFPEEKPPSEFDPTLFASAVSKVTISTAVSTQ